jgi:hydrogenase nickel incorporation protein HypA/HybF
MHELSIASALMEGVLKFADERRASKVLEVRLAVGELTAVEHEQLRFCFAAITKETVAENAELQIESVKTVVQCPSCSYRGTPKYWDEALTHYAIPTLICPQCGKSADAVQGHECSIRAIRFAA